VALAETFETHIGDPGQATLAYDQALQVDEHCLKAIEALERLHRRTQAWERLATCWRESRRSSVTAS